MLKTYETIHDNGQIKWLTEQPDVQTAKILITVLGEANEPPIKQRSLPESIAGKGQTLGDIVSPIVDEAS